MINFTDAERAWHSEMRGLAVDQEGRAVLVGLTMEESEFYVTHIRKRSSGDHDRNPVSRTRFLELHEKHEIARLQIIEAENYVRRENPPRQ
jgi:hypothetical protein